MGMFRMSPGSVGEGFFGRRMSSNRAFCPFCQRVLHGVGFGAFGALPEIDRVSGMPRLRFAWGGRLPFGCVPGSRPSVLRRCRPRRLLPPLRACTALGAPFRLSASSPEPPALPAPSRFVSRVAGAARVSSLHVRIALAARVSPLRASRCPRRPRLPRFAPRAVGASCTSPLRLPCCHRCLRLSTSPLALPSPLAPSYFVSRAALGACVFRAPHRL